MLTTDVPKRLTPPAMLGGTLAMPDFCDCPLLEGIVTTENNDGTLHIAAMGPRVDWPVTRILMRPFQSSTTFRNLCRTGKGILHVVDDVLLMARVAVGRLAEHPHTTPTLDGYPPRLADCVRWYAFHVESLDDSKQRSEMVCTVVDQGQVGQFFGFNRARHAVIEAAILATRMHLLPIDDILDRYGELATIVEKTAGPVERQAFAELQDYVNDRIGEEDTRVMLD